MLAQAKDPESDVKPQQPGESGERGPAASESDRDVSPASSRAPSRLRQTLREKAGAAALPRRLVPHLCVQDRPGAPSPTQQALGYGYGGDPLLRRHNAIFAVIRNPPP